MIAQAHSPTKMRGAERPWLHVISYSFTTGFRVFPSVGPFLRSRCSYQPRISHINLPAQNCLLPSRFDKTSCTMHAKKQLCDASRNHKLLSVTGIQSGLGRQACASPLNRKCQSNRAKTHTASWFCSRFSCCSRFPCAERLAGTSPTLSTEPTLKRALVLAVVAPVIQGQAQALGTVSTSQTPRNKPGARHELTSAQILLGWSLLHQI